MQLINNSNIPGDRLPLLLFAVLSHLPHLSRITTVDQSADIGVLYILEHVRITATDRLQTYSECRFENFLTAENGHNRAFIETKRDPAEQRASMTWAQRLKRVFTIDIETCRECGGTAKVIACIEDPVLMPKALRGAGSQKGPRSLEGKGRYGEIQRTAREPGASANKPVRLTEICTQCTWLQPWAGAARVSACLRVMKELQSWVSRVGKESFIQRSG